MHSEEMSRWLLHEENSKQAMRSTHIYDRFCKSYILSLSGD